jgi:type I restriction enzyme, R subunit
VRDQNAANILAYREMDGRSAGVIQAKKEGVTPTGVKMQSDKYTHGLPEKPAAWSNPLPFSCESTGIETRFINGLHLEPTAPPSYACSRSQC